MIKEITVPFNPYQWQVEGFRKFVDHNLSSMALLADVGVGKTAEAILLLRYLGLHKIPDMKVLIIGPGVVIYNWKNEIIKYCTSKDELGPIYPLAEAAKRKSKMKDIVKYPGPGVVITNYESFDSEEFCKLLSIWKPDVIVGDELHRIKSYKSKRAKAVVRLREDVAKYAIGLTGSAILNSPMDLFQQWKFLDCGITFGRNFFDFRNYYFSDENAGWSHKPGHFPKWVPRPELFSALSENIQHNSIRVVKSECMDLPPYIEETIKLEMSPKQRRAYEQMHKDFIAFVDNGGDRPVAVVAQLALTKALRLMQIASGFVQAEGEQTELDFSDNPKLDAVEKIIEDNPDQKIIVWCSYKANYRAIAQRLESRGIKFVFLTGEQDAKEKQASIDAFQTDPDVRVIVANRKAGGIGVNLTAASISVVFSRNFSLEEEIQSDGRNYRGGSQIHERITKINLIMEGTIEEQIGLALKNKQKISDLILDLKEA
jgi:SNF2 family DNA or RNA helicase